MSYPTKIATCCHCGSRAALTLDRGRHELACANCGAPLRDLKRLPLTPEAKPAVSHQPGLRQFPKAVKAVKDKPRKQRVKRRKSLLNRIVEEVVDLVEDVFD